MLGQHLILALPDRTLAPILVTPTGIEPVFQP